MQEIGESREQWGCDVWNKAQDFANQILSDKPFYVVFAAKSDKARPNVFRQAFKAYYSRPPKLIGVLVWFVDKAKGLFDLVPELSIPPDVPLDPELLSKSSKDASTRIMEVGQELGVVLS
jgi:hypothetical protein